ncbi:AAA family ATPase [Herpetosiphon geysericola]|uniref:ABC transporter permease n=1 Tax=Herpetosiphon geysericola TaxID=70996 RepID=A0A0P6Y370_9CHLR|nr:DUF3696 domain-containing protein [Herpetosiphon geysericola]KPL90309.1 ABC transporter permease [Herpetosiphon geysericola]
MSEQPLQTLESIVLHNFKCFGHQKINLGKLTLLSGLNGMGKSSVIQSLLLLRQSFQQGLITQGLAVNGDLVRLGTAQDVFFESAEDDTISIGLKLHSKNSVDEWSYQYNSSTDVLDIEAAPDGLNSILVGASDTYFNNDIIFSNLFTDEFQYLQAERIGPRTSFGTSDYLVRQHRQLGPSGEYAIHYLSLFGNELIPNEKLHHEQSSTLTLRNEVEAWLSEISPGTRINISGNPDIDLVSLRFSFVNDGVVGNAFRATNVGFGLTYTLPILVAVLSAKPNSLLLIENPEAHLHPRGQALMGQFLAYAAAAGVQIVVESHSDHVLNGIRLAVHDGKIDPADVQLNYFERRMIEGQTRHTISTPTIDQDGLIDQWPDGFFDEFDKSLERLMTPRS